MKLSLIGCSLNITTPQPPSPTAPQATQTTPTSLPPPLLGHANTKTPHNTNTHTHTHTPKLGD